jgi:hypothetical protein
MGVFLRTKCMAMAVKAVERSLEEAPPSPGSALAHYNMRMAACHAVEKTAVFMGQCFKDSLLCMTRLVLENWMVASADGLDDTREMTELLIAVFEELDGHPHRQELAEYLDTRLATDGFFVRRGEEEAPRHRVIMVKEKEA